MFVFQGGSVPDKNRGRVGMSGTSMFNYQTFICLFFQGGPVLGRPCLTIRPSYVCFSGRTSVGTSMFNYQTFICLFFQGGPVLGRPCLTIRPSYVCFFREDQCWDVHV